MKAVRSGDGGQTQNEPKYLFELKDIIETHLRVNFGDNVYYLLNMVCRCESFISTLRKDFSSIPAQPFRLVINNHDELFTDILHGGFATPRPATAPETRLSDSLARVIDPYLKLAIEYWNKGLLIIKWHQMYREGGFLLFGTSYPFGEVGGSMVNELPVDITNDQATMLLYYFTQDKLPDQLEPDGKTYVFFADIGSAQRASKNNSSAYRSTNSELTANIGAILKKEQATILLMVYIEPLAGQNSHYYALIIDKQQRQPTRVILADSLDVPSDVEMVKQFCNEVELGLGNRIKTIVYDQKSNYCGIYSAAVLRTFLTWTTNTPKTDVVANQDAFVKQSKAEARTMWQSIETLWKTSKSGTRHLSADIPKAVGDEGPPDAIDLFELTLADKTTVPAYIKALTNAIKATNIGPFDVRKALLQQANSILSVSTNRREDVITELSQYDNLFYLVPFVMDYESENIDSIKERLSSIKAAEPNKTFFASMAASVGQYLQWFEASPIMTGNDAREKLLAFTEMIYSILTFADSIGENDKLSMGLHRLVDLSDGGSDKLVIVFQQLVTDFYGIFDLVSAIKYNIGPGVYNKFITSSAMYANAVDIYQLSNEISKTSPPKSPIPLSLSDDSDDSDTDGKDDPLKASSPGQSPRSQSSPFNIPLGLLKKTNSEEDSESGNTTVQKVSGSSDDDASDSYKSADDGGSEDASSPDERDGPELFYELEESVEPEPTAAPNPPIPRRNPDDAYYDPIPLKEPVPPTREQLMEKVDNGKISIIAATNRLVYNQRQHDLAEEYMRWQNVMAEAREQRRQQRSEDLRENRRLRRPGF